MKTGLAVIIMAVLSYISGIFLPWWSIAIVTFLVAFILRLRPGAAFVTGFSSIFLLWFVLSYVLSSANGHVLATKMAGVVLQTENPFLLMLVTGLTGGVVAGLAALSAGYLTSPGPSKREVVRL